MDQQVSKPSAASSPSATLLPAKVTPSATIPRPTPSRGFGSTGAGWKGRQGGGSFSSGGNTDQRPAMSAFGDFDATTIKDRAKSIFSGTPIKDTADTNTIFGERPVSDSIKTGFGSLGVQSPLAGVQTPVTSSFGQPPITASTYVADALSTFAKQNAGKSPFTASQRADTPMKEESRPAKRMKLDFLHQQKIVVGAAEHPQTFHVPRNLISSRSIFLKDAQDQRDREAIALPDDDPRAFSVYLQCVHENTVVVEDDDTPIEGAWPLLAHTYILAVKLGDITSINLIMDEVIRRLRFDENHSQLAQAIKLTFDKTPVYSKLRKVFVDHAVHCNENRSLIQNIASLGSTDFLAEAVMAGMDWRDLINSTRVFGESRREFIWSYKDYHVEKDEPKKDEPKKVDRDA